MGLSNRVLQYPLEEENPQLWYGTSYSRTQLVEQQSLLIPDMHEHNLLLSVNLRQFDCNARGNGRRISKMQARQAARVDYMRDMYGPSLSELFYNTLRYSARHLSFYDMSDEEQLELICSSGRINEEFIEDLKAAFEYNGVLLVISKRGGELIRTRTVPSVFVSEKSLAMDLFDQIVALSRADFEMLEKTLN